jgi:hypothetical protein
MKRDILHKQGSTIFLRLAVIALGLIVLALCIFAVPAIAKDIGNEWTVIAFMRVPFILIAYTSALIFYIAMYHVFKLISYVDQGKAFSELSVKALKYIKYCAIAISFCYAAGLPFIYMFAELDDAPGVILIGMTIVALPLIVGVFASVLQVLLQNAIDIKRENELTV